MGTQISAVILTSETNKASTTIELAFAEIKRIEDMMTDWNDRSEVAAINRFAGIRPVKISPELMTVLVEAQKISALTDGKFDVTYKGAGALWDFKKKPPVIPSKEKLSAASARVDYTQLVLNSTNQTAFLSRSDMQIGLGGIAKGYGVDRAMAVIKSHGFKHFAINAGGDLACSGRKQGGLWWVGIRDPRTPDENIAVLPISNLSVVTSGDYERFFILDGKRYSHILDPDTGWPINHCQSVSVMAKTTSAADALATGVFVLGPKKGLALLESLPNTEGVIIDANGHIHVTNALQSKPTP